MYAMTMKVMINPRKQALKEVVPSVLKITFYRNARISLSYG
jgi:hypothetical protein